MRVKGTILRTRMEFVRERYGPDAPARLLDGLSVEDRRLVTGTLPGSWIPFPVANRVDESIARVFAGGAVEICRQIGAFSANKNLATVYHMFLEQSGGDPQRLMESLATLHRTLYDWGWTRAVRAGENLCRLEGEYERAATRANCLTAVGFYSEALKQLKIQAEVRETACQVWSNPLCVYEISWTPR